MARATLVTLTLVAACLFAFILVKGRSTSPEPGNVPASQQVTIDPGANPPLNNAAPSAPITVPVSPEKQKIKDIEASRGEFYDWIRSNLQPPLVGWQPNASDHAVLELYLPSQNGQAQNLLLNRLVQPFAIKYGFTHVRFLSPDTEASVSKWHLDAEADPDARGMWRLYVK